MPSTSLKNKTLQLHCDRYDVYCYAEDDQPPYPYNGPNVITSVVDCSAAISQDNLAPQLEVILVDSPAKDRIRIVLRVDEGAKVL